MAKVTTLIFVICKSAPESVFLSSRTFLKCGEIDNKYLYCTENNTLEWETSQMFHLLHLEVPSLATMSTLEQTTNFTPPGYIRVVSLIRRMLLSQTWAKCYLSQQTPNTAALWRLKNTFSHVEQSSVNQWCNFISLSLSLYSLTHSVTHQSLSHPPSHSPSLTDFCVYRTDPTVAIQPKNVEKSCFSILEHNNAWKAGHTQISEWVCCIDFCSLKMVLALQWSQTPAVLRSL